MTDMLLIVACTGVVLAGYASVCWRAGQGLKAGRSWAPLLWGVMLTPALYLFLTFAWQRAKISWESAGDVRHPHGDPHGFGLLVLMMFALLYALVGTYYALPRTPSRFLSERHRQCHR